MAAAFTSVDIEERQILLFFENDDIPWHHRVLTLQIEGPKWICATPDLEVQSVNLINKDIRALARNAEIPVDCRPVYMFDPIDDADMQSIRAESRRLAEVLGVADKMPASVTHDANWIFSDPAHESFGLMVPDGILAGQARFVVRGSFALVQVEVGDGSSWTVAENVARVDKDEWLNEKHCGPGRDPRLAPTPINDGKIVILRDQLRHLVDQPMPRWAFKGPRAIVELLSGVAASGHELLAYPQFWQRTSGVSAKSSVAIEFAMIFTLLHLLVVVDGLNPVNLNSAEHAARRARMIQRAVKRSPHAPDFEGLDVYISNTYDSSGGVLTLEFDKFVSEAQRADALIMKQHRLLKEEVEADDRRKRDKKGDKKGKKDTQPPPGGGGGGG